MKQRTEEWRKARYGKVTASTTGAALGMRDAYLSRGKLYDKLVYERTNGEPMPTPDPSPYATEMMQWGTDHEEDALASYMALTGNLVLEAGLVVHQRDDWLAASPDGLIPPHGGVETKCPPGLKLYDVPKQNHLAQCHMCIYVCGAEWWDYVCWVPDGLRVWRVMRDDAFWDGRVMPLLSEFIISVDEEEKPGRMTKDERIEFPIPELTHEVLPPEPPQTVAETDWPF